MQGIEAEGKGRGDVGGQGNERLCVNFYLGVGCDAGLSSGIFSVIWANNRVISLYPLFLRRP